MNLPANNPSRHALLIHHGAIGDFLVASRLIELCNNKFGPFRWGLLGKPPLGRLARTLGLIEEYYDFSIPGWHLFFTPDLPIDPLCQTILNRYDLILNIVAGPQTDFAKRLTEVSPNPVINIDPKLPADYSRHVYQYLAEQLTGTSIDALPSNAYTVDPEICSKVIDELHDRQIDPQKLILIHPGASGQSKRWPIENFLHTADFLRCKGNTPVFLLGEVELEQFSEATIKSMKKTAPLFTDWPLERLSALISAAKTYIGNDNGISHLAAVVGAHTQVIFIKPNACNWKPLGPRVTLFTSQN